MSFSYHPLSSDRGFCVDIRYVDESDYEPVLRGATFLEMQSCVTHLCFLSLLQDIRITFDPSTEFKLFFDGNT